MTPPIVVSRKVLLQALHASIDTTVYIAATLAQDAGFERDDILELCEDRARDFFASVRPTDPPDGLNAIVVVLTGAEIAGRGATRIQEATQ